MAQEIGIDGDHVFANVKPGDKSALIEACEAREIAVSRASDVAREAADIVLLASDSHAMPANALAQAPLRTIKQNPFGLFSTMAPRFPWLCSDLSAPSFQLWPWVATILW